jgi:hypothetical protein
MGFFDKVKELALKAKCGVGMHAGEYSLATIGPACLLEKTCPDCFEYLTKNSHSYGEDSYKDDHSCIRVRYCKHCNHEDSKTQHAGFSAIGRDDFCKVQEECNRCGFLQAKKEDHNMVEVSRSETHKTMECANCNKRESTPLSRY